ncbi:radical SAM protein [Nitrospirota bacterium]
MGRVHQGHTLKVNMKTEDKYDGFEIGLIRPPSEANSLLLRITRNCPWNKCKFCGLYKGEKFSIRSVSHVIKDVDLLKQFVDDIHGISKKPEELARRELNELQDRLSENEWMAYHSAINWYQSGMRSIFLQDANSLIMKPEDLIQILKYLREVFPHIERITSYARSSSLARISEEDMALIYKAGLNRIHVGMESASDEVLKFVNKGVDKATHIIAGQKVKNAGIELSEYFMPGLGGETLSEANALETADAMNQTNPDFIRIRTLAVPEGLELFKDCQSGAFTKMGEVRVAEELLLFLESLEGITSTVKSDHILNLLEEVEGTLPHDKERMTAPIKQFLAMPPEKQVLYMVGRRAGIFSKLSDMEDPLRRQRAEQACKAKNITPDNVDSYTAELMKRFI